MPLPAPPDTSSQGRRTNCHIPANSMRGLPGTITRCAAPVESFTNRTFCHVLPPSAVRYTPRSELGAQTWPSAATNTMSGLAGSITIWETWPTSLSPMNCQLLPASGDMKTPRPSTTSFRGFDSPVPTHTTFGFEGASATAPIDAVGHRVAEVSEPEVVERIGTADWGRVGRPFHWTATLRGDRGRGQQGECE